jgi:hypothetical protein
MNAETLQLMIADLNEVTSELLNLKPALSMKSGEVANKLIAYLDTLSKPNTQAKPLK